MPLANRLFAARSRRRLAAIDAFRADPAAAQQATLRQLLDRAAGTQWGRQHGYGEIRGAEDFRGRVPLGDYNTLRPWIDRARRGERDLLWPGATRWFAKSSGTTGDKSKYIPVTADSLRRCQYQGSLDALAIHLRHNPLSRVFAGKTMTLGGSRRAQAEYPGTLSGDLSAIMVSNAPLWTSPLRTPAKSDALIEDFELKIKKIAQTCSRENVVCFAGVPSWYLALFREVLRQTGRRDLTEVWPNLQLFLHGGVSFAPYRQAYAELIPAADMAYIETYNASEGFFAIQDTPAAADMLLMLDLGVYYEFIPLSEVGMEHPTALTVSEVRTGTPYAMVISTNGGLWRYQIGDVVEFTSLAPHKIIITGRTKQYINVFGEELMLHNALDALGRACQRHPARVADFTVAPVFMGTDEKPRHQWLIEFEQPPANLSDFAQTLDNELRAVNSDYDAKRFKNSVLHPLELIAGRPGLFFDWMRGRGRLGGQNKVPNLSCDRRHIDQLLALNAAPNQRD